jgi:hypothetical protein
MFKPDSRQMAREKGLEPPRVCRRLQLLRGWGYGEAQEKEEIFA